MEYDKPSITADFILHFSKNTTHEILLIERGNEPCKGCLAIPGGFFEPKKDQSIAVAAHRELKEEVGVVLDQENCFIHEFMGYYDAPDRDTRDRVVTFVFYAELKKKPEITAGDDAAAARWVDIQDILDDKVKLAFDHRQILRDFLCV